MVGIGAAAQFGEGQRVACGLLDHGVQHLVGREPAQLAQQAAGLLGGQPGQRQLRQVGEVQVVVFVVAHGQQDGDGFGAHPAGGEQQGGGRCRVQPVRVVHDQQQRRERADADQQAVHGRGHDEFGGGGVGQGQCAAQCGGLGLGQVVEVSQHRGEQLVQAAEGEFHLGLDSGAGQHTHAGGVTGRVP